MRESSIPTGTQFRYLTQRVNEHLAAGDPVVSLETKKEELAGNDTNAGWISVDRDYDTAALAVATLRSWWQQVGRLSYSQAQRLLVCADSGGSDGSGQQLWKAELARLAAETGVAITVCHLPPGTSKWNRIEHRMFAHISTNWRDRPLERHAAVVQLIGATTSRHGLAMHAALDEHSHAKGITITDEQMAALPLTAHAFHPDWNYTLRSTSTNATEQQQAGPRLTGHTERRPVGRRPGSRDVARLAGVSQMTVSRVVNGHPMVRPSTRARVRAAMDAVGYRPNVAAQTLVTGRARTIGVVSHDTQLFGPASMLASLQQAARSTGHSIHLETLSVPDARSLRAAVSRLLELDVAGIAAMAPNEGTVDTLAQLRSEHAMVPIVGLHGPHGLADVEIDQSAGVTAAVDHLLDLGHETIAHIAGPDNWTAARTRTRAWRDALTAAGLEVAPWATGDWTAGSGYRAARELLRDHRVTALFVSNDHMALGAMHAIHESGRRVPEDISVVGFDDIPEAAYLTPALTTVHQPFDDLGRTAHKLLLRRIDGDVPTVATSTLSSELRVRASTGRPQGNR